MNVLIDIGNTRIKWACARGQRLETTGQARHAGALESGLERLIAALPDEVARVLVASVAGDAVRAALAARLESDRGVTPRFLASRAEQAGVRCAYADPARLGVDRWVAMIAAHHACEGAVAVVDAGTTVTFDAVDAAGQHLGGLILAGPRMTAEALSRRTEGVRAALDVAARPAGLELLGRSTDEGVGRGTMLALSAAIERATDAVADALGAAPTVLLTGGDALGLRPWLEMEVAYRADLVLEGLALLASIEGQA